MSDESDQIDQNFQDLSDRIGDGEKVILELRVQVEEQRMALEKMQAKADADTRAAEAKIIGAEVKNRMQEQSLRLERDRIDELFRRLRKLADDVAGSDVTTFAGWTLSQDGGVAGGVGVTCSFTYTLADPITGNTYPGVPMSGSGQRIANVTMTAASYGLGWYDSSGDPVLVWADEVPDQYTCPPPA